MQIIFRYEKFFYNVPLSKKDVYIFVLLTHLWTWYFKNLSETSADSKVPIKDNLKNLIQSLRFLYYFMKNPVFYDPISYIHLKMSA